VTAPLLIILVIVGFALVFTQLGGSSSSSSSGLASGGTSAPGAASAASGERSASSARNQGVAPEFETNPPEKNGQNANFAVSESGTRYQGATLASQVRQQLDAQNAAVTPAGTVPGAASSSVASSAGASAPAPIATPTTLAGCVSHLTGGVPPSLVDRASYDGIPAYVIAVPSRAWVVRLGCTAADPQEITSVSLTGLYPGISAP
jgi:hypothetical protein